MLLTELGLGKGVSGSRDTAVKALVVFSGGRKGMANRGCERRRRVEAVEVFERCNSKAGVYRVVISELDGR